MLGFLGGQINKNLLTGKLCFKINLLLFEYILVFALICDLYVYIYIYIFSNKITKNSILPNGML